MSPRLALTWIVIAEFFGTSLWFCGAVAAPDLATLWSLSPSERSWLLSATQFGFIVGTLSISISGLADRFKASRIFATSAFLGASCNASLLLCHSLTPALASRFAVGLCLAGIYPLGMKLVIGWAPGFVSSALGWLVGALVLGTATPHMLRGLGAHLDWSNVILASSLLALVSGCMIGFLGEGPSSRSGAPIGWANVRDAFRQPGFRASALGYFGHMWELYAFWSLVPALLLLLWPEATAAEVSLLSFAIMGLGGPGCVLGGRASQWIGAARVAAISLSLSFSMAVFSYFLPGLPFALGLGILFLWGLTVVSDSPQFSALSAAHAPPSAIGSGLAVQNAIGFAITLFSIDLLARLGPSASIVLAIGPLLGLWGMRPLLRRSGLPRSMK